MNDEKKKEYKGYAIGGALSVAGSYFVGYVQLNELFSWPPYVYTTLSIFVGVLVLSFLFSYIRFLVVNHRDSKQEEHIKMPNLKSDEEVNLYRSKWKSYLGLDWIIESEKFDEHLNGIEGPFCPKDRTKMIARKTFFGRYEYECSTCLLKVRRDYNRDTLENRLQRVAEAELTVVKKQRSLRQKENYAKMSKKIKDGFKNMWDDA